MTLKTARVLLDSFINGIDRSAAIKEICKGPKMLDIRLYPGTNSLENMVDTRTKYTTSSYHKQIYWINNVEDPDLTVDSIVHCIPWVTIS